MLTPEDIEKSKLRRSVIGGYNRDQTKELLGQVASELRQVLEDRDMLEERLRRSQTELLRREKRDEVEIAALKSIQQTAREVRDAARHDAELILRKAYKHASEARGTIDKEYMARVSEFRTLEEKTKVVREELRAMLTSVLRALDEPAAGAPGAEQVAEDAPRPKQPAITGDLERAVRELVQRIQRKPGVAVDLPRIELDEPTADIPATSADVKGEPGDERVA